MGRHDWCWENWGSKCERGERCSTVFKDIPNLPTIGHFSGTLYARCTRAYLICGAPDQWSCAGLCRIRGLLTDMALGDNGFASLNPPRQARTNAFSLVIILCRSLYDPSSRRWSLPTTMRTHAGSSALIFSLGVAPIVQSTLEIPHYPAHQCTGTIPTVFSASARPPSISGFPQLLA